MTVQVLGENLTLILKDGTLMEIHEEFNTIWIHPKGLLTKDSYRLNLTSKTIDTRVDEGYKP